MSAYQEPSYVQWPPFYTLQVVEATRTKQLEMWREHITGWCRHRRCFLLEQPDTHSIFRNTAISRALDPDGIAAVVAHLITSQSAMWLDKSKKSLVILWKSPQEWAECILKWANDTGHTNMVCTFFELQEASEEFGGMPDEVLCIVLAVLEKQNKARVLRSEAGATGVKFL
eukprot:TRINITY_DN3746_c0_g1_i2.p1 TRINITY_DN3746_c0_g1~~TRINITY_DN3746_c0_g1_i2.p1  ORF type:complete len:171 (+),score=44.80 TRINITY_DN3746_c0_g1_i2:138-650(+)